MTATPGAVSDRSEGVSAHPFVSLASDVEARRRFAATLAFAVPAGAFATWYGFLESGGTHPTLKLVGAMAIAGLATASLTIGRPVRPPGTRSLLTNHSALVEVHPLTLTVAWASMSAALIHFAVIQQHFSAYYLYGWFFVAAGSGQLGWAALTVVMRSRPLLALGAIGNGLLIATWVMTRTYGTLLGPDATQPAKVGFGDLVSTLLEAVIVVGAVLLIRSDRYRRAAPSYRSEAVSVAVALGITLITVLGLYSAVGGSPFVSHVG